VASLRQMMRAQTGADFAVSHQSALSTQNRVGVAEWKRAAGSADGVPLKPTPAFTLRHRTLKC
jgi:hypothetical protein